MIPETPPYNNWIGDGVCTQFDFDFLVEAASQLIVVYINSSAVRATLVKDVDYSIHEIGNKNGSYITFPIAGSQYSVLGPTEIISLKMGLPIIQEDEYGKSADLDFKTLEHSFDYLTRICQIQQRELDRAVKVQEGAQTTPDALIEIINTQVAASQVSATAAAASASSAVSSANIAIINATAAETSYNSTVNKYNEVVSTVANEKVAIEALSIAEQIDIRNLGNSTKTNIQSLGIFMEDNRLFYFDSNGVKHEFRNDFGGIAPMSVKHKEIKEVENGYELTWSDPDDSCYQNNVYCTWANTVIVRKVGSYPQSPFDGQVVVSSSVRNEYSKTPYIDEVDTSIDYKYRAFPRSINNVYSQDELNKFGQWIYSLTRLKTEAVPSKKIVYRGANEHYNNAYMNFTSNTFDYGDWGNAPFLLKDRLAPCVVGFDGEVKYFLNPNNYKQKEDGTASEVTDTSKDINCFMRFKLLYRRKRKDANGNTQIDISNIKVNDEYKPYGGFIKTDGTLREYIYLPIYRGSLINSKNRSMSGNLTPMSGQTAPNERTYCQNNGLGHDMITHSDRELIEDLSMLMFKTTDFQTTLGQGKSNGGTDVNACLKSGTMDDKGYFYGSISTAEGIKLFGMENRYASQWERTLGEVLVNGVRKVKLCQGTSDGSTVDDYNFTGDGYIALSELPTITGTSGGYISVEQTVDDVGTFPVVVLGSSSTYECDGMWFNNAGTTVAFRGGASAHGAFCGLFCSNLNDPASNAYWTIGSSVSYKPL